MWIRRTQMFPRVVAWTTTDSKSECRAVVTKQGRAPAECRAVDVAPSGMADIKLTEKKHAGR